MILQDELHENLCLFITVSTEHKISVAYAFYEFFLYMANLTLSTVSDGKRMKTLV